jgi:hypothetical protein
MVSPSITQLATGAPAHRTKAPDAVATGAPFTLGRVGAASAATHSAPAIPTNTASGGHGALRNRAPRRGGPDALRRRRLKTTTSGMVAPLRILFEPINISSPLLFDV